MKKIIILLLSLALMPLSGCGAKQGRNSNELTIAAFMDSEFLNSAARKYEQAHEGVTVNITFYGGEEKDLSKYSQIINTALMSGKGEDIIDVCDLTWTKLADKNKLADIDGLISLDSETYYMNITDAFLYKGKRYVIPLSFFFEAYKFDDAPLAKETAADMTLQRLIALWGKYQDKGYTALFNGKGFGMSRRGLAYKLFSLHFKDFLDAPNKTVGVDSERFISLLESISAIKGLAAEREGDVSAIKQYLVYSPAMTNMGTINLSDMFFLTNEDGQAGFEAASGFMPAVNAGSPNKELAADFIRFLLSEEMMTSPELSACPINKKAASESAKLVFDNVSADGSLPAGFGSDNLEQNIEKYNALVERLAVVEYADHFIMEFVMDEMRRYFEGEESAEQAAKNLQSRLNTYLKE